MIDTEGQNCQLARRKRVGEKRRIFYGNSGTASSLLPFLKKQQLDSNFNVYIFICVCVCAQQTP